MILTDYALKRIGFEKKGEGERIEAQFYGLHIYRLLGVNVDDGFCATFSDQINGVELSYGLGSDLDRICDCLLGDVLTNNTPEWEKEKGIMPPYVAILVGPTETHVGEDCHFQEKDDILVTYECFQAAKDDLVEKSSLAVPRLISAIECKLSVLSQETELVFVDYLVSGKTKEGDTVSDIRFQANVSIKVSRAVEVDALSEALERSAKHGQSINSKVANFFNLASQEKDALKKFLYYFLSIEIITHQEFQKIDHERFLKDFFSPPKRVSTSAHDLFQLRNEHMTFLKDRFVWCSLCVWEGMNDDDIVAFKEVKKIRDDIGHGKLSSPSNEQVDAARNLARKVLLQQSA